MRDMSGVHEDEGGGRLRSQQRGRARAADGRMEG